MKRQLIGLLQHGINMIPANHVLYIAARNYMYKYDNLYNADPHKNGEYWLMKKLLHHHPQPLVFDVGANIGDWSQEVLNINPRAHIHAFEPVSTTFEALQNRFINRKEVICVNQGLGRQQEQLEIQLFDKASAHNTLYGRHDKSSDSTETITITTLDAYCTEHQIKHIDYLKIDTEGHEFAVFQGLRSLLNEGRLDIIQFEYADNYIFAHAFLKDIYDFIGDLPYSLYLILPHSLRLRAKYHEHFENFMYCNYVLIRDSLRLPNGTISGMMSSNKHA